MDIPPWKIMVKSNKFANKLCPGISHWISTYAPNVDKIKAMIVPAIVVITEIINGWDSVGFLNTEMYPQMTKFHPAIISYHMRFLNRMSQLILSTSG